jgi:hypothetical protein
LKTQGLILGLIKKGVFVLFISFKIGKGGHQQYAQKKERENPDFHGCKKEPEIESELR